MIRNERQYRTTVRQRRLLADALDKLLDEQPNGLLVGSQHHRDQSQLRAELDHASLAGQIADLDAQLREYEVLRAGGVATVRVASFAELPDALIRARIGSGLTQRELGDRLGLKEQQIQRYESERYASASLSRLQDLIEALGVELEAGLELPTTELPMKRLRRRLRQLGLHRHVVDNRLLRGASDEAGPATFLEVAERAARLLSVPLQHLLANEGSLPALATTARFKAPKNAAQAPLDAYTRYAESIADIVLRATQHLGPPPPLGKAQEVRAAIEDQARVIAPDSDDRLTRSDLLLAATLRLIKNLRIPVIAMRDPGAFHGACFTREGRSVIVLKQTADSASRWLNDLLHELHHTHDLDNGESRSWIELGDISEWSDAPEEQSANNFAADVLFSGRAADVLTQCVSVAQGSVERLKAVVPRVARQAEVPIDVLADHLAFQLSRRGISWWATAATFQEHTSPWRDINDVLLQQLDLTAIDATDRAALINMLAA